MKFPWKKNFNKVPKEIHDKLGTLKSSSNVIGAAKKIPLADVANGVYSHLGIRLVNEYVMIDSPILPSSQNGRYSKYNNDGRTFSRRDLPKVDKTFTFDAPNYGNNGTHPVSRTRLVYQREYWYPQNISLLIEKMEEDKDFVIIKINLDTYLNKNDQYFERNLLYHLNLLQENFGVCNVFEAEGTSKEYIDTLHVTWELLPPGHKNNEANIAFLLNKFRNPSPEIKEKISDRMVFFDSLEPINLITGENRFSNYFGALLKDDIVILENVWYGNAIYILFQDWEELSKLSRTELLSSTGMNFERVIHTGNWKNRVINAITNRAP